jgi:hypothetical protein
MPSVQPTAILGCLCESDVPIALHIKRAARKAALLENLELEK